MIPLIDKNALFREMEKAQWYNNADRDEVAEELVLNAPIIEIDTDTVSRQDVINVIEHYCDNGCEIAEDNWCPDCQQSNFVKMIKALPPSPTPSRQAEPHTASLETPCDDCDFADKCTYESNCPREAIWKAEHEGGAV